MEKILLVEDNEFNRDMLSRRLERKGYKVICALDGEQAIALAKSDNPDLILMDMSLPILNGWEATRRIRVFSPTVPIIALTAHAMPDDQPKAKEAGCNDYDTKPVELTRLLSKMEALLHKISGSPNADPPMQKPQNLSSG